ncbi:Protein-glutamate O-methyltransferase [Echinococcus granulosus]|nr:Protein-glutamate O-methyltransferase [Echinococcus granulosus]
MPDQALPSMLNTSNSAFALVTIKDRLPVILVKTLDDLVKCKSKYGNPENDLDDIKSVISEISKLRYELMTNKPFVPLLPEPDAADIDVYNEAVLKRLMNITINCGFPKLDLFHERKAMGFFKSAKSLVSMCECLEESLLSLEPERLYEDLKFYLMCSLWSNEFDLSLKADETELETHTDASQLRLDVRIKTATQMVVDDLDAITSRWPPHLAAASVDHRRTVVLVMDNTAPEMFADLVLGEFLLGAGLAERIVFMPKIMPWFVSDATQFDFDWLLKEALPACGVSRKLAVWAGRWSQRFHEGSFAVELHAFWTLPFGYNELQTRSPDLYCRLTTDCNVVIFKGDLNYRKLLEDRLWAPDSQEDKTTAFRRCFPNSLPPDDGGGRGSQPLLVALRVAKSDVAVGLTSPRLQAVRALDPQWWVKGLFGFAQLLH